MKKQKFRYHYGLKCLHCESTIYSLSRHHFVSCNCPRNRGIFVDGGFDYFRYGFENGWVKDKDYKVIRMKYEVKNETTKDARFNV